MAHSMASNCGYFGLLTNGWLIGRQSLKGRGVGRLEKERKSSQRSQCIRFVIVRCSLQQFSQVGLLNAASEKRAYGGHPLPWRSVLSSPVCRGRIAKYGHVSRILR